MEALQFFLVGVLLVWLLGTGKLAAFVNALRNAPATTGPGNTQPGQTNPATGLPYNPGETGPMGNPGQLVPGI